MLNSIYDSGVVLIIFWDFFVLSSFPFATSETDPDN